VGVSAETWTCPTCSVPVTTPRCAICGEKALDPRELTLRGFLHQAFEAITDIDSRLIRSFRTLVVRPGFLTAAWVRGQRLPYLGPFQIFLIANVLFFALQSLTDTNVVSDGLDTHLNSQEWGRDAQMLVAERLDATERTLAQYTPVFDQAIALHAKSLIILMVLPFAMLLPLLFFRSRMPFVAHLVFSLHFHAFALLLFCFSLLVAAVDQWIGGEGLDSVPLEGVLATFNTAVFAVYLYHATGRFYGESAPWRVIKVAVLALAIGRILMFYRYGLFLLTLYTT
jgi:hypothetical protein